jgi:hypothetical protein
MTFISRSPRSALFAVVALPAFITLAVLAHGDAGAQSIPELEFDVPGPGACQSVDEGDEVTVSLAIDFVEDMRAWEATITYDRGILEVTAHDTRHLLAKVEGARIIDASEPLPDINGRHLLAVGSSELTTGSGVLGTITFRAVGEGSTTIDIPQRDINGDGKVDEGATLTGDANAPIGDVNGDRFFDGSVQRAVVAVGEDCSQPTDEPTDPPTPGPDFTTAPASGSASGGGTDDPDGSPGPGDSPTPSSTADPAETPDDSEDASPGSSPGTAATGGGGSSGDGGSSFPIWALFGVLAVGLMAGSAVVLLAMRKSTRGPLL